MRMFDFTRPDPNYYCEKEEPFIGRERLLRDFWQEIFSPEEKRNSLSLCGPHGVGKSALLRQLRTALEQPGKEEEKNTYFLFYDMPTNPEDADVKFAKRILVQLEEKLPMEKLQRRAEELGLNSDPTKKHTALYEIQKAYDFLDKDLWTDMNLRDDVVQYIGGGLIFLKYKKLGIHFVLVVEEFDRAPIAFPKNEIFQHLYGLSHKGSNWAELNMNVLLVSRQAAGKIGMGRLAGGSSFADAYHSTVISGFNNRELEEYFKSYEPLPCGVPDEEKRKQILYLCGRHPALLMDMRRESMNTPTVSWDVDQVWQSNTRLFHDRFATMCRQLETEHCSDQPEQNLMQCFLRTFVYQGMQLISGEEACKNDKKELENAGYVTSPASAKTGGEEFLPSIFVLCGLRSSKEETMAPEPISPAFVDYVRSYYLPHDRDSVVEQLLLTERKVRALIRSRMQEAYGDRWESVVAGEVDNCKMRYQFAENTNRFTARYGAGSVGLLDTLSFVDYCAIITKEVRIFGSGYRGWDEDWNILKKMRDINAHNSKGVLNRYTVQDLKEACERFDNWMEEVSHRPMPEEQPAEKPMVDERPKKVSEVVPDGESKSTKGNTVYNYKLLYRQEENDCELQVKVVLNGEAWNVHPKDGKWPDGMDELEKTAKKEQILAAHTRRMRATETN